MALRDAFSIILKLLVASLIVGLLFSAFDINPRSLLRGIPDLIRDSLRFVVSILDWAIPYILLGAAVVVPVFILFSLFKVLKRR